MAPVILDATFEDMTVRVIASLEVALERGRDLAALGWTVEIRDEDGAPVGTRAAADPDTGGDVGPVTIPDDVELPSVPSHPDATVLREVG